MRVSDQTHERDQDVEQFDVLAERGEDAARRVASAFEEAGDAIADALGAAARSGELDFSSMAEAVLQDLARIALEIAVLEPLRDLGRNVGDSLADSFTNVIGQRQHGGPVMAGAPYLVGEQGPEVFVPNGAGAIAPTGPAQVININIQSDRDVATTVLRSERQISAAIARAAAAGGRSL